MRVLLIFILIPFLVSFNLDDDIKEIDSLVKRTNKNQKRLDCYHVELSDCNHAFFISILKKIYLRSQVIRTAINLTFISAMIN